MTITAYCYRSGEIEFLEGTMRPISDLDMLPIMTGADKSVRDVICATSRHAKGSDTLLVPGLPEARNDGEALDALDAYRAWLAQRNPIMVKRCGDVFPEGIEKARANQVALLNEMTGGAS